MLWNVENVMVEHLCTKCFALYVLNYICRATTWDAAKFGLMSMCSVEHFNRTQHMFRGGLEGLSEAGVLPVACKMKREAADHKLKDLMIKHEHGAIAVISDDNDFVQTVGSLSGSRRHPIFLFRTQGFEETTRILSSKRGVSVQKLDLHRHSCRHFPAPVPIAQVHSPVRRAGEMCRDFRRGQCFRGDRCRYVH